MAQVDIKNPTINNNDHLPKISRNPDDLQLQTFDDQDFKSPTRVGANDQEAMLMMSKNRVVDEDEDNNNNNKNTTSCKKEEDEQIESGGREKLFRHRNEVAGRVCIPEKWGQEKLLKDWMDCSIFDELLAPKEAALAREALIAERKRERTRQLINMERMISN
ncbi:OLC1v1004595C1 [Oldenlandia corymbosa var. corymbosa]|uniref:OLC1v1004595C1 n=1 Tax=Oldenlandia corymbosa var. corymbosa TaxID=529605 RepID=A0AAV1DCP7_OLDCO|nr:OLC1v1004595C1 [Oldenlandia corymbosa var. corymbosa]